MIPEIITRATPDELALVGAQLLADSCRDAIVRRAKWRVALTGGSSPVLLYKLLASREWQSQIDWARAEVFFGDERAVAAHDERSNFYQAHELLLRYVPQTTVYRMRGEAENLDEAAREYEAQLGSEPLDAVLLGMGPDSHTASLFPGYDAVEETSRLCAATPVSPTNPLVPRLTLTLPCLNAARLAFFTVTGRDKAAMLKRVLSGDQSLPSARVTLPNGRLLWLLDDAAANATENAKPSAL